ncbi:hypothetical protein L9F63_005597, partial [Diploptera punctata]
FVLHLLDAITFYYSKIILYIGLYTRWPGELRIAFNYFYVNFSFGFSSSSRILLLRLKLDQTAHTVQNFIKL